MKNKAAKQKSKRKGSENAFGCDLSEHLQSSGHDVPQVLKTCAEFIEKHGIVDGIYRLSGITSNIQRLRQEFISEQCPDLTKEVYLQDIHCVGSLCKLYFRELPNPLLTYELYQKFTDAVSVKEEHERLRNIQHVIKELPIGHFRTLEYLAKHLAHLATLSHQTNMHTRNLALVWAPNLLRWKEIEVSVCNGDEAFLEVRVQQSVVEFILNHTEQIFNPGADPPRPLKEGAAVMCVEKYATLPAVSQCPPMKLMSLEEAQARTLAPNHPARTERLRENSLPDTSTAAMYHTVIELSESKRKFSGKSKKWKSIFSLGRSVADGKGKLSRNGSVFMRAQNVSEKTGIRPSKSMDSLCSLPTDEDRAVSGRGKNGFFAPVVKSRTLGSDINYDPNEQDPNWEFELRKASGETGHSPSVKTIRGTQNISSTSPSSSSATSSPLQRALPEQLKVFKGDELTTCRPTSPKNRRMLYSGSSHNGPSRPSFPGSLFPLESSPRHQRKALNISEPFAVSVPLRVSAVISSNSTPCRVAGIERERSMGSLGSASFREPHPSNSGSFDFRDRERLFGGRENPLGNSGGYGIYSNSSSVPTEESQMNERSTGVVPSETAAQSGDMEVKTCVEMSENLMPSQAKATENHKEMPQSSGKELDASSAQLTEPKKLDQLDIESIDPELWSDHELRITEPETNVSKDLLKTSGSMSKITGHDGALNRTAQAKRRSSLPTHPVSSKEHFKDTIKGLTLDRSGATLFNTTSRLSLETPPNRGVDWNYLATENKDHKSLDSFESLDIMANKLQHLPFLQLKETDILQDADPWPSVSSSEDPSAKKSNDAIAYGSSLDIKPCVVIPSLSTDKNVDLPENHDENKKDMKKTSSITVNLTSRVKGNIVRLSKCSDERRLTIEIPSQDDDDIWGSHLAGLDQVEPWEDLSTTKQWVTSPLHSTKLEDLFPLFKTPAQARGSEIKTSPELSTNNLQKDMKIVDEQPPSGKVLENAAIISEPGLDLYSKVKKSDESGCENITELLHVDNFEEPGEKVETNQELPQPAQTKTTIHQDETTRIPKRNSGAPKPKTSVLSQRFHRQVSHEPCIAERNEENIAQKHRPYSLNLDLGNRCIRDISNQQNLDLADHSSVQRGAITPSGTKYDRLSVELEMFLRDRQAPMRRNSAPVSVSSVRTAFMIKTCQAKAVPVIPPKVQYSHIPHLVHPEKGSQEQDKRERGPEKLKVEKADSLPPLQVVKDSKEERENCKPVTRIQRQASMEKTAETCKAAPAPEFPVLRRKRSANGDSFMDCPRPERSTLLQRSSFRNRPRPQSLILFSPPFPIMDYHPTGDDGKLVLSPIKSPAETSPLEVLTKELAENLKTPDGVTLRNKMTLPKSGQRLETSTSCFYQPQRRSMIFDNRSSRQIE
ncbi:rho GTPase-activating protein 31 [Tachysurus vachellii]|uniref:rho GTPase-activating protein 31 n=1 Tax=Tachysurus vachellii TaxID=175792 RepID=UPI00296AF60C|nr:rho GTPase-activating protein 31 [Tachysurus vachellii]